MGCRKLTYHQESAIGASWEIFISGKEKTASTPIFCIDYYAGGMIMPGRSSNFDSYRFGFNGMESDDEVSGEGNSYTTEFRQYDPRLMRWRSTDPLSTERSWVSPYNFAQNNPITRIDPSGALDDEYTVDDNGNVQKQEDTEDDFDVLHTKSDWDAGKKDNGEQVNDKSILPSLEKVRTDVDGSYSISTNKEESFKVFEFMANNTGVEWSIDGYRTSDKNEYIVNTSHIGESYYELNNSMYVESSTKIEGYDEFNLIFDIHSHPGTSDWEGTKGGSSGDGLYLMRRYNRFKAAGMQRTDTWFKKDDQWTVFPKHYVYHKQNKTLYHYNPWETDVLIRNINKASDLHRNLGF